MSTPEERLATLLAQPEQTITSTQAVAGLLEPVTARALNLLASGIVATQAAGSALFQARQQRQMSMRQAGQASGRSAPRVKAIEDTGTDITLSTIVEHAQALGYTTQLVLTPLDGNGPAILADLGITPPTPPAAWESELKLPAPRKKVRAK